MKEHSKAKQKEIAKGEQKGLRRDDKTAQMLDLHWVYRLENLRGERLAAMLEEE